MSSDTRTAPRSPAPEGPSRRRRLVKTGLTLALVALVGWIVWEYVGTNVVADQKAGEMVTALSNADTSGDATTDKVSVGEVFAVVRIPRFGKDAEYPVVQGVDDEVLTSGVGHFPETERPGQVGNFAIAGHRVTRGQPFRDFPDLRRGDTVEVQTRTHRYVYELDDGGTDHQVDFSDTSILGQVPFHPGRKASQASITLTTCSELFHTDERSVVVGHLVTSEHL